MDDSGDSSLWIKAFRVMSGRCLAKSFSPFTQERLYEGLTGGLWWWRLQRLCG
jgi:hypothetical protein